MKRNAFVAAAAALAVLGSAAVAQAGARDYRLLGPAAVPATADRAVIAYWSLPLDKSYEQLSSSEVEMLRNQYTDLRAHEEPPFPTGGLARLVEQLQHVQDRHAIHGELYAVVQVDAEGQAQQVSYLRTPEQGPRAEIERIIKATPFKPASCGRRACAMEFPLHVDFRFEPISQF